MKFHIRISQQEIKDLIKAWFFISLAFAIARIEVLSLQAFLSLSFLTSIIISGFTVGIAFLFHEMAHKMVAQHYHCWAEFRADISMLMLALLTSFLGFIIAAPGAVWISGHVNKKQNGIISMAGPLMNIVLAVIMFPFIFLFAGVLKEIFMYGFFINSWLALFNMIPFGIFDGSKILKWNKVVYGVMLIISLAFVFLFFLNPWKLW